MYIGIFIYVYICHSYAEMWKNALIDSSSPNLCGKSRFQVGRWGMFASHARPGAPKWDPQKLGVLSKWMSWYMGSKLRRWNPLRFGPHKKCHLFFLVGKKKNHDPPGISTKQILESQGVWMIFWFIVFVVCKIRGKHGFYYTFKCICCTKIRVSHLTF